MIEVPNGNPLNPLLVLSVHAKAGYRCGKYNRRRHWYNRMLAKSNKPWLVKWIFNKETFGYGWWESACVVFLGCDGKVLYTLKCKSNADAVETAEHYKRVLKEELDSFKEVRK